MGTGNLSKKPKKNDPTTKDNRTISNKTIKSIYTTDMIHRKGTNTIRQEIFWEKQTDTETSEDHLEKRFELEKESDYPELIYEFIISKFIR